MVRFFCILILNLVFFLNSNAQRSLLTENQFEKAFQDLLVDAHLKFKLPNNFSIAPMKDVELGDWQCAPHHSQTLFDRVLKNSDSTVYIGIRILINRREDIERKTMPLSPTNFKNNAISKFTHYGNKIAPYKYYDEKYLDTIWGAKFGIEYERACTFVFKSKYAYNRIVALTSENWELEIFYIFLDGVDINHVIKTTRGFIVPL
ncbi:hypothetical protein [Pedobacter sp. UYP24]